MKFRSLAFLTAFVLVSFAADAKLGGASSAKVEFTAKGPGGLNIVGRSGALGVRDEGGNIVVEVPIDPISTGIELRDKHMREHLEAAKFPKAQLTVARSALQFPADGSAASGDAQGTLNLHGQTKPVRFHYEAQKKGGALGVKGTMGISMPEFGITPPKYLGVGVAPDVSVQVTFSVADS